MKKKFILVLFFPFFLFAQIPAGYYNAAEGKQTAQLKTALYSIVSTHTQRSYGDLWTDFQTTDVRADGKVWDMYSNCNFTFGTHQDHGSGGGNECEFYNREHSFPKSWFNDAYPMYTDLFHLYPTDKKVNNVRSNYPFGEVGTATYTANNGSKLGTSNFTGYSGTVFEPINEYKGDFARTYFYMSTCYENKKLDYESGSAMFTNAELKVWAVNLLLKWHRQDPVSAKETNRNNAIYGIQHNRNPFIDRPELAEYIWGNKMSEIWYQTTDVENTKIIFSVIVQNNTLSVKTDAADLSYTIYNITGQTLKKENLSAEKEILLDNLRTGVYIIRLENSDLQFVDKFFISANK
ncbi:MAG: endonuclease [Paludibacter sp.]|nr:endonuclease [Paludibacter sp.]